MNKIENKKSISFYKWTWQSYIRNALIPLIVVQFIFICIYLSTNTWLQNEIVFFLKEQSQNELYESIKQIITPMKLNFIIIFLGLILSYFLFFSILVKKAKRMSSDVANSISKINSIMEEIGNGNYTPEAPDFNITELNDLSAHLITMGQHLSEANKKLLLTQSELREKEADIKALVNSINDIIMEVNFNGDITNFWSRSHYDLYTLYTHGNLTSIYYILEDQVALIAKEKISHVINTKQTVTMEFNLKLDPSLKWFEACISPRLNDESKVVILARDITEQKKLSESIILAKEEAEKASMAKSEFLSSMSHELRTPLNAILGFSQILELDPESPLTESQSQSVKEIIKAGDHLLELINEVLDLAKIESGKLSISIESVAIKSIMEETLAIIKPFADKNGIKIINYPITNFDEFVSADHTRLKQILLNLLSNAIKYNKENGTVTFYYDKTNNKYRFHVIDTGIGLSISDLNLIFKPFQRLSTLNNSIEGTGIGLTVAKQLVELMNGQIYVTSDKGAGSHFWVEFPLVKPNNRKFKKSSPSVEQQTLYFKNKNYKVLYVEDNPANLRLVGRILSQINNLQMLSAASGELCVDLALAHKPDLILLDINLPGIDGYEVFKRLKMYDETKNIPVIAISAHAMPKDIKTGISLGFRDYITKPINISSFIKKISNALNKTNDFYN